MFKILLVNFLSILTTVFLSLTPIMIYLREGLSIIVLLVSLGYTIWKWRKEKRESKEE